MSSTPWLTILQCFFIKKQVTNILPMISEPSNATDTNNILISFKTDGTYTDSLADPTSADYLTLAEKAKNTVFIHCINIVQVSSNSAPSTICFLVLQISPFLAETTNFKDYNVQAFQ